MTRDSGGHRFGAVEVEWFSAPGGFHVARHGHTGVHFTLLREGSFEELRGQRLHLEAGDIRVSPSGDEHELRFGPAGAACLIVALRAGWIREVTGQGNPDRRKNAAHPLAQRWIAELVHEVSDSTPASVLAVESVALELAAWSVGARRPPFDAAPSWLLDLRDQLHDVPVATPSLVGIAHRAGRHPVCVARAFRRHFGRSIGEYSRDLRVRYATSLLTGSDEPMVDIAIECGFSDQAHFARWVKRLVGDTPGQVRRSAGRQGVPNRQRVGPWEG